MCTHFFFIHTKNKCCMFSSKKTCTKPAPKNVALMQACRSISRLYAERKRLGIQSKGTPVCVLGIRFFRSHNHEKFRERRISLFCSLRKFVRKFRTKIFRIPKGIQIFVQNKTRKLGEPNLGKVCGAVKD